VCACAQNDPEIVAMVSLRTAYEDDDIDNFDAILNRHKRTITNDPFICECFCVCVC